MAEKPGLQVPLFLDTIRQYIRKQIAKETQ